MLPDTAPNPLHRDHEAYHLRRLEQQMLDTLLRIEEILARAFPEVEAPKAEPAKGKRK